MAVKTRNNRRLLLDKNIDTTFKVLYHKDIIGNGLEGSKLSGICLHYIEWEMNSYTDASLADCFDYYVKTLARRRFCTNSLLIS